MSSIKTINYNNPVNFNYNASLVDITTTAKIAKLGLQSGELSVYTGFESKDADRSTGTGVAALGGSASYNSTTKAYDLVGSSYITIPAGDYLTGNIFPCSFKIKFNYTGWPASNTDILATGDSLVASGNGSGLWVYHANNGNIYYRLVDSTNSSNQTKSMGVFNSVAGQEYDFEIVYDMVTGVHKLFIDGVIVGVTAPTTLTVTARDYLRIGTNLTGTSNTDYSIWDIKFYDSIQNTVDFSASIPRNIPLYNSEGFIESLEATSLDGLYGFSSVASTPNGSTIRYAAYIDDVLKYYDGVGLSNSDGSLLQTNTLEEIAAGISDLNTALSEGAEIRLYLALTSGTNYKYSPEVSSSTIEYDFYSSLIPNTYCTVWGYILDGSSPVEGATISFKNTVPFFNSGSAISINEVVTSRANGYFEVLLPETTTPSTLVDVKLSFIDSNGRSVKKIFSIQVPAITDVRMDTIIS